MAVHVGWGLQDHEHEIQLLFGVSTFLLLSPGTYTGRIMSTEVCISLTLVSLLHAGLVGYRVSSRDSLLDFCCPHADIAEGLRSL